MSNDSFDLRLVYCRDVRLITESVSSARPLCSVSGAIHIASNHRDYRLRKSRAKLVRLNDQRRAPLRSSLVRVRDNTRTLSLRRKLIVGRHFWPIPILGKLG
jgi:hypothetical protein